MREFLTVADLVAMPHLGLQLAAGGEGATQPVLWTHTSELEDPGPWLEGGELLIVNGFGIPENPHDQVEYVARLAHHRLAGLAVSVKAPELTRELLEEADRLSFPVLRVPRQVPFIEISYLVANASERSARGRLSRHLRIFETLRYRNSVTSKIVEIYSQLELVSGYRLALVSPAGLPLLPEWSWVPDDLDIMHVEGATDLQVLADGYVLPLVVGDRVTAYLIGKESPHSDPGGLAALQHVSTLAALDAVDDQRRREAQHRQGSVLLASALDADVAAGELAVRFAAAGIEPEHGMRFLACESAPDDERDSVAVRDWLADRHIPHLLLEQGSLLAVVQCADGDLQAITADLGRRVGASSHSTAVEELPRLHRQALWSLRLAKESGVATVVLAEEHVGLGRWLNQNVETLEQLTDATLLPLVQHDSNHGTQLMSTLAAFFQNHGRMRSTATQLFVHEHTVRYRLNQIEQLTKRSLKSYRDSFELWLAVETSALSDEH